MFVLLYFTEPWMLIVEYAHEGPLLKYLKSHRPGEETVEINDSSNQSVHMEGNNRIDTHKLLSLAAQVASGLQHLQKFKVCVLGSTCISAT